jgi:hypothetical protein
MSDWHGGSESDLDEAAPVATAVGFEFFDDFIGGTTGWSIRS